MKTSIPEEALRAIGVMTHMKYGRHASPRDYLSVWKLALAQADAPLSSFTRPWRPIILAARAHKEGMQHGNPDRTDRHVRPSRLDSGITRGRHDPPGGRVCTY